MTGPDRDLLEGIAMTQPYSIFSIHVYPGSTHGEAYLVALCSDGIWQQRLSNGHAYGPWTKLKGPNE